MADLPISGLPALLEVLAPGDLIEVTDISDTSEAATGTSKKATVEQAVPRILLETITDPVSGEFDFTSIPSGFNRLIIKGKIRSQGGASGEDVSYLQINGDTATSNYHSEQNVSINNGGPYAGEYAGIRMAVASNDSIANAYAQVEWILEGYTDSNLKMVKASSTFFMDASNKVVNSSVQGGHISTTSAITQLTVVTDGGDNLLGTLHLYGEF